MNRSLLSSLAVLLVWSALVPSKAEETVAPVAVETAPATDQATELAKKLSNPISSLISLPIQTNYDFGGGPTGDGFQFKTNVQPVIPITLNEDWNLISRTVIPIIDQENIFGTTSQSGLSDIAQSFFFSPVDPTSNGWIWGAGPVLLFPTATDNLLGTEKWGAGPTAVALKQSNGWTYGALANHIWSYAGDDLRQEVDLTYLQPFLSYTTPMHTTYVVNAESTYDWTNTQWTVPINVAVSQLVKIGGSPVQFQLGGRYYAEAPDAGPDWGLRFGVTLLWPK